MASFCSVTLVGNVTRDPKQVGKVVRFSVAVNSGFGERAVVTYYDIAAWGKTGESVMKYIVKGKSVGVTGRLEQRTYKKKDGSTGTSLDVAASDVTFLSPKSDSNGTREVGGEPMDGEPAAEESEAF